MALFDNRMWILSHIHNSFVSSDDTGVCEMVLSPETFREDMTHVAKANNLELFLPDILAGQEEVDSFRQSSPDIKGHQRPRAPSTLQMRQKLLGREQDKGKVVAWRAPPPAPPDTAAAEQLFPRKQVPREESTAVSRLAQQLEGLGHGDMDNPWQEFGVYEGVPSKEAGSKCVEIFPNIERRSEAAITVWVGREARVRDVIGLTCLKYCHEARPHQLQPPLEDYDLFMCEEDGTVDADFPALDIKEPFHKYGFAQLALVKKDESQIRSADRITLYLPDGTFTELEVNKTSLSVGELLEMGLQRRSRTLPRDRVGFTYHLETAEEAGVSLDPAASLGSLPGAEFYLVRDNSKRVSTHRDQASAEKPVSFLDAPLFQSFNVQIISKVRTKIDIHLGISGDKVEIDPQQQPSTWSVYKQKAATYDMDHIVSCDVVARHGEDRLVFKMVYLTDSDGGQRWRAEMFEGDREIVEAIIGKINHLIEMKQSQARKLRKEYLENKEKKKSRRLSVK